MRFCFGSGCEAFVNVDIFQYSWICTVVEGDYINALRAGTVLVNSNGTIITKRKALICALANLGPSGGGECRGVFENIKESLNK